MSRMQVQTIYDYEIIGRDVFGDSALVGDFRWAGTFGVSGDFIARDNCRSA
jgi:hypothetical protein